MDVGSDLEEAQYLLRNFSELLAKLKANKSLITESVLKQESANDLSSLWNEADKQLDLREKLLKQSIKFHTISKIVNLKQTKKNLILNNKILNFEKFSEKMDLAAKFFEEITENEISDPEIGYSIIENHKKAKKEILETSLITFDEGKELIALLREMSLCADLYASNVTNTACYSIETILETLNDRRCYLEEFWQQRRQKLEQCIQIFYLKIEIKKVKIN